MTNKKLRKTKKTKQAKTPVNDRSFLNYAVQLPLISFLLVAFVYVPLKSGNRYFDMIESKAYAYKETSVFLLVMAFFLLAYLVYSNRNSFFEWFRKSFGILDLAIILFAMAALISSLNSLLFSLAWSGAQGWFVGGYAIVTLSFLCIVLSKGNPVSKGLLYSLFAISGLICLETVFEAAGFDLLKLHDGISYIQYYSYFSTIGNTNWYVGYLSLLMPIFLGYYLNSENRKEQAFFFVLLVIGCFNIHLLHANGIYLAFGFCAFFAIPYVFQNLRNIKRLIHVLAAFSMAALCISLIPSFAVYREYIGASELNKLNGYIWISVLLILLPVYFVVSKTEEEKYEIYKGRTIVALESMLLFFVVSLVLYTAGHFSMSWGTGRAEIWSISFAQFKRFSIKQKLFGLGPEMLMSLYSGITSSWDSYLMVSHSEWIQALLSMGYFGLFAYIAPWAILFISFIKTRKWISSKNEMPYFLSLFAYFGQALVNSCMMTNAVLLSAVVILAILYKNK